MMDYHAPLRKSEKHNELMNELTQSSPSESLQGYKFITARFLGDEDNNTSHFNSYNAY